jgi:hypothetical protein
MGISESKVQLDYEMREREREDREERLRERETKGVYDDVHQSKWVGSNGVKRTNKKTSKAAIPDTQNICQSDGQRYIKHRERGVITGGGNEKIEYNQVKKRR